MEIVVLAGMEPFNPIVPEMPEYAAGVGLFVFGEGPTKLIFKASFEAGAVTRSVFWDWLMTLPFTKTSAFI